MRVKSLKRRDLGPLGVHDPGAVLDLGYYDFICLQVLGYVAPLGSPPRTWGIRIRSEGSAGGRRFTPTHVGNTGCCPSRARTFAVHPHARGEYGAAGGGLRAGERFTPTHVGNTAATQTRSALRSVHPHARGEYLTGMPIFAAMSGSPPRTWGIRCAGRPGCCSRRFTPTHVGNTPPRARGIRPPSVHPHARGEYLPRSSRHGSAPGSPPRTWGILGRDLHLLQNGRFTPTHVGNTLTIKQKLLTLSVHPHARGEYFTPAEIAAELDGSPPRTWGIPLRLLRRDGTGRFTPTHVGNTLTIKQKLLTLSVHPHARGEYFTPAEIAAELDGSPPRTWGIPLRLLRRDGTGRFTPTHVGNTTVHSSLVRFGTVHPHARGEYYSSFITRSIWDGSPPRTWGILDPRMELALPDRFTPTHVGNTS